jgi:hypothetical protein
VSRDAAFVAEVSIAADAANQADECAMQQREHDSCSKCIYTAVKNAAHTPKRGRQNIPTLDPEM